MLPSIFNIRVSTIERGIVMNIPEYNKIQPHDDITMVNAKLNAVGKMMKNLPITEYADEISDIMSRLKPKLVLEQQIVAKDFRNMIAIYNSVDELINNKCISVCSTLLKVRRII